VEITEVRIKLMDEAGERLQAFCSITFDDSFVIRDLKIIEGAHGPFVAMPSRKLTTHCHQCGCKNHLRAAYCNQCGSRQKEERMIKDEDGRAKLYADIAHPINSSCREMIQQRVVYEFQLERERAKLPGYVSRYDDFDPEDAPVVRRETPAAASVPPAVVEQTRVQPAEPVVRGPHRTQVPASAPPTASPASSSHIPSPHTPPAAVPAQHAAPHAGAAQPGATPSASPHASPQGNALPHSPASPQGAPLPRVQTPHSGGPRRDGFGAGIF
jgi:stage V sporulation protein G